MNILHSLFKIIRPYNVFLSCMAIPIAFTVYSKESLLGWIQINSNAKLFYNGFLLVFFYTSAANTINDVFDIKTDKINRPNRPLASNQLERKHGIVFFIFLIICGIYCSTQTNTSTFYFSNLIILPFILLYTPVFKNIPILGNLIVSFIIASVFLFVQLLIIEKISDYLLFALAFSFSSIREMGKDMADINGDKSMKIMTFAVVYGLQKSMYCIYFFMLLTILVSITTFIINGFNFLYLTALIITVYTPLFISIFSLQKTLTIQSANQFSKTTKAITVMGMLTVLLLDIKLF